MGYRGGLVFKAHRLLYHSTLGSRVIKKKMGYQHEVHQSHLIITTIKWIRTSRFSLKHTLSLCTKACLDAPFCTNRRDPSLAGPVDPLFRALSGHLKFTVRRHKFNTDSLFSLFLQKSAWSKSGSRGECWRLRVQGYLTHKKPPPP